MVKSVKTYLFCYDDHRNFSEEVRKRFSDQSKYIVASFHNLDDFKAHLSEHKEHNYCKVAILGLQDTEENFEMIEHLTIEVKNIDGSTGIILICPPGKVDEIRKKIRANIDSYVPRNANQVLRIHNTVKKLISEHSLMIYRKRRNFSFYFLLIFLAASILLAILAYFRFPEYF